MSMKILFVLAHPNEGSFSHQLTKLMIDYAQNEGIECRLTDLYAESFSPVLNIRHSVKTLDELDPTILKHFHNVQWADALVFLYPIWWWDRPAILKGWFDSVFVANFAFKMMPHGPVGMLNPNRALCIQTLGGTREEYERGNGRTAIEGAIGQGTLQFCGVQDVDFVQIYSMGSMGEESVQKAKDQVLDAFEDMIDAHSSVSNYN